MSAYKIIIFDFDGVILESIGIKKDAFGRVFESYPDKVEQIVQYHMDHGGLSRFKKFEYIYREILKETLSEDLSKELGRKFTSFAYEGVLTSSFVPGAQEFLERHYRDLDLFVASGTPHEEMIQVVRERGLEKYFKGVYGSPASKGEIITHILKEAGADSSEAVMVGDASTDYEGAKEAGVDFIGRVHQSYENPFAGLGVTQIHDLTNLSETIGIEEVKV